MDPPGRDERRRSHSRRSSSATPHRTRQDGGRRSDRNDRREEERHRSRSSSSRRDSRRRSTTPERPERDENQLFTRRNVDLRSESQISVSSNFPSTSNNNDDRKMDHVLRVLTEMAATQNLSSHSQSSLTTLCQHMQVKTYKERAHDAVRVIGLNLPESSGHMTAPALCNPKQTNETKGVVLPLGNMVTSRIVETWRSMCGLKGNDTWYPDWEVPPANPTKTGKPIPKPNVPVVEYGFPLNEFLSAKSLKTDYTDTKSQSTNVPNSRLGDWEGTLASCLGIVNMIDIFSSSLNYDMGHIWECLETYREQSLPPDLINLHEQRHRIKADLESRAKALQHLTSLLTWLLAETISTRREQALSNSKLSESSQDVLRMQPFGGPFLFGGRANSLIQQDSGRRTAELVLKLNDNMFVKKRFNQGESSRGRQPSATVTRATEGNSRQEPFRRRLSYRGRGGTRTNRSQSQRNPPEQKEGKSQPK